MNFYAQLAKYQKGTTFRTAVTVEVRPDQFECSTDTNYAYMDLIDENHTLHYTGVSNIGDSIIQYNIFSETLADVISQAEELIDHYEGNQIDIGDGYKIKYAKLTNIFSDTEIDTVAVYSRVVEFTFRFETQ